MTMMPESSRLAARPHWGVFPIPFVTHLGDGGRPDFRVHDEDRRMECARSHLCQLCGGSLSSDRVFVFVGTSASIQRHTFGEPPMHRECMEFAWQVCPWLAGGGERRPIEDGLVLTVVPPDGDRLMGVYATAGYCVFPGKEGVILWEAWGPVEPVEFRERLSA